MTSPAQQRLLAAALADRLIHGGGTEFHAEDAVALHGMLPTPSVAERLRALLPGISARGGMRGPGLRGAAAGGLGDLRMEGADRAFGFDLRGRRVFRAGQWKLMRTAGLLSGLHGHSMLTITQVMGEAEDELEVRIPFRHGRPRAMERSVMVSMSFGGLTLGSVAFRPWKSPVWGRRRPEAPYDPRQGPGRGSLACSPA